MTKDRSPLTVLILLFVAFLSACHHHSEGRHPAPPPLTTLKIPLNGPWVILLRKSAPGSILVFSPRDPSNLHQLYVNNLENGIDQKQNYRFRLERDGLKPATVPSIDPYLADFNLQTDSWADEKDEKHDKYFVTIELPVPDKITFAPPLFPVYFESGGAEVFMATNFILEYQVTDRNKLRLYAPQLSKEKLRPLSSSELQEQYAKFCAKPEEGRQFHASCIEMRNLLEQCAGKQTSVFFFGVGIPSDLHMKMTYDEVIHHAVYFFNEVILKSFPNLKSKRVTLKPPEKPKGVTNGYMVPISWKPPALRQPVLNMSAVIDCKAGGAIVRVTQ